MLKQLPLDQVNAMSKNTLMKHLGIVVTELGSDYIVAEMPVDFRTHQPMKLLHGGASAALIESIGSFGSALIVDLIKETPVGLEVNANHIRGISSGWVSAKGKLVHAGRKTHVWTVEIVDKETQKMICVGRLTVMIVAHS